MVGLSRMIVAMRIVIAVAGMVITARVARVIRVIAVHVISVVSEVVPVTAGKSDGSDEKQHCRGGFGGRHTRNDTTSALPGQGILPWKSLTTGDIIQRRAPNSRPKDA